MPADTRTNPAGHSPAVGKWHDLQKSLLPSYRRKPVSGKSCSASLFRTPVFTGAEKGTQGDLPAKAAARLPKSPFPPLGGGAHGKANDALKLALGGLVLMGSLWLPGRLLARDADIIYLGQTLRDPGLLWAMPAMLPVTARSRGASRPPEYDWQNADAVITAAQKQELQLVAKFYLAAGDQSGSLDYRAFLAAAAERYNQNGIQDAAGLQYPVLYWVIEPEMDPDGNSSQDPEAFARFAAECGRTLNAVVRNVQTVISLGSWEYSEAGKRLDRQAYWKMFFPALKRYRDADVSLSNFIFAFSTLSEPCAFRHFSHYVDFLSDQRRLARLSGTAVWCLETGVVSADPSAAAVETLKRHLFGMVLGIRELFFWTPTTPAGLKSLQPDPVSWMNQHSPQPAYELFKLARTLLEWADWDKAQIIRSGEDWLIKVPKDQELVYVYWSEKPVPAEPAFTLKLEKENGPARVYTLSAAKQVASSEAFLKEGSVELPVSAYPIFLKINKTKDCNCQ